VPFIILFASVHRFYPVNHTKLPFLTEPALSEAERDNRIKKYIMLIQKKYHDLCKAEDAA